MFPMSQPLTLVCLQDGNILFWNRATSTLQHFIQNTEFIWREKLKNLNKSVPYAIVTLISTFNHNLLFKLKLLTFESATALSYQCYEISPLIERSSVLVMLDNKFSAIFIDILHEKPSVILHILVINVWKINHV